MNRRGYMLLIFMLLLDGLCPALGQGKRNAFTIDNDQMALYIDLKLSKTQIDSLLRIADIKGTSVDNLIKGDYGSLIQNGWTIRKSDKNILVLLKPLEELGNNPQAHALLITQQPDHSKDERRPGYPRFVMYGVNSFTKVSVHELPTGLTRFFLPGNLTAKKVLLSGNFNNWTTLHGLMVKTDSGWIGDVKLNGGQYLYKFIIDGRWRRDINNRLKEEDGYNDYNSIYFRYNYTFKLSGYASAARVIVAGSFNNWNATDLVMLPKGNAWYKSLYLADGMNTYRFFVDGKWITDPGNPNTRIDATDKPASVINIGAEVTFRLKGYPNAKNVFIAGDFNGWKPNDIHLKRSGDSWVLNCILPVGNYSYKFIVDGNWMTDPANGHHIMEGNETNSVISVKPNHTFILHGYGNAQTIILSGSFNDWNESGYTMSREGQDWKISLHLKPGKYLYKLIVDGSWIIDPGNKQWEQNQFGTGNSVLWME